MCIVGSVQATNCPSINAAALLQSKVIQTAIASLRRDAAWCRYIPRGTKCTIVKDVEAFAAIFAPDLRSSSATPEEAQTTLNLMVQGQFETRVLPCEYQPSVDPVFDALRAWAYDVQRDCLTAGLTACVQQLDTFKLVMNKMFVDENDCFPTFGEDVFMEFDDAWFDTSVKTFTKLVESLKLVPRLNDLYDCMYRDRRVTLDDRIDDSTGGTDEQEDEHAGDPTKSPQRVEENPNDDHERPSTQAPTTMKRADTQRPTGEDRHGWGGTPPRTHHYRAHRYYQDRAGRTMYGLVMGIAVLAVVVAFVVIRQRRPSTHRPGARVTTFRSSPELVLSVLHRSKVYKRVD